MVTSRYEQLALALGELGAHPRAELLAHQDGKCCVCSADISLPARACRDLGGRRISGLLCVACSNAKAEPSAPPVLDATPLLRLRLTQGPLSELDLRIRPADRAALASRAWDHFSHPGLALWTWQRGVCALRSTGAAVHPELARPKLDHDHHGPGKLVRGWVTASSNSLDGKGARRQSADLRARLAAYRRWPPAQSFEVTRGMSYAFMTTWDGDRWLRERTSNVA